VSTPAIGDRCSLRSLAADEALAGTASIIRHWLLIEHGGPWGRDGLLDARLPEGLGEELRALERETGGRVLLIRRQGRIPERADGAVRAFAVDTREAWLGTATVDRIEETILLDPRDRSPFADTSGPLFAICTHGRRDPCCAERGRPVARSLAGPFPDLTWECTHVGGDRFAGNLVAFPHGLYFGRLDADEAPEIARRYAEGWIGSLDRYRGRASHAFVVQRAEVALRTELGLARIDDVRPTGRARDGDHARVTFATGRGPYGVRLERVSGVPMRLTCHATTEQARPAWRVLGIDHADDA
jgi:hypothetical protein